MSKVKIYKGAAVSRGGVWIDVEIWRDRHAGEVEMKPRELHFALNGICVTWDEADLTTVLQGSRFSLLAETQSDREFCSLYEEEPGSVCARILVEGELWWQGTLDPELYEEPYERADHYDSTLTFVDFGVLDRMDWDAGLPEAPKVVSLMSLLERGVAAAMPLGGVAIEQVHTLGLASTERLLLDRIGVGGGVFGGDDPKSLSVAIIDTFAPMGLRVMQRGGKVWVYDINAVAAVADIDTNRCEWSGDSQTLSTGAQSRSVSVNVNLETPETLFPEFKMRGEFKAGDIMMPDELSTTGYKGFGVPADEDWPGDATRSIWTYRKFIKTKKPTLTGDDKSIAFDWWGKSFTLYLGTDAEGVHPEVANLTQSWPPPYFHISPIDDGEECDGIAPLITHGAVQPWITKEGEIRWLRQSTVTGGDEDAPKLRSMATFRSQWLPKGDAATVRGWKLNLQVPMLLSCKYNPFSPNYPEDDYEKEESGNSGETAEKWEGYNPILMVPVRIILRNAEGVATHYYSNKHVAATDYSTNPTPVRVLRGGWMPVGADGVPANACFLSYYNWSTGGVTSGFETNKPTYGRFHKYRHFMSSFKAAGDGEHIPYPPAGGYIEVQLMEGLVVFTDNSFPEAEDAGWSYIQSKDTAPAETAVLKELYGSSSFLFEADAARWLLFKAPTLSVAPVNRRKSEEGAEYSAWVRKSGTDTVSVDSSCGTADDTSPATLGQYLHLPTSRVLGREFWRTAGAGMWIGADRPEWHHVTSLIAQTQRRCVKLTGEATIDYCGLQSWGESNQRGKTFMITGERADLLEDTAERTLLQVVTDGDLEGGITPMDDYDI